jgi:type II secretory pathway component PulL
MKSLAILVTFCALGFIAYGLSGGKRPSRMPTSIAPLDKQSEKFLSGINESAKVDRAEIAYKELKQKTEASARLAEVAHTCLDQYHRDSCLQHLINCGASCKALIPDDKFLVIQNDYWTLMKQRGLQND